MTSLDSDWTLKEYTTDWNGVVKNDVFEIGISPETVSPPKLCNSKLLRFVYSRQIKHQVLFLHLVF